MPKIKRSTDGEYAARGDILWLKPWPAALHEIFNHPVMIDSLDVAGRRARVLILSSLGGKDLTDYGPRAVRKDHLPIHPSPPHPYTGELLYLRDGLRFPKKTYVKTKTRYWVSTSFIDWTGKKYQLRSDSLAIVDVAIDADVGILDGMASKEVDSGEPSNSSANQKPAIVQNNVPDYGSTCQYTPKILHSVEPPPRTWSRLPLPSSGPLLHTYQDPSFASNEERLLSWREARYQQRSTSGTLPLLPIHARYRRHRSGWLVFWGICVIFLVFMCYMAYWIHGFKD